MKRLLVTLLEFFVNIVVSGIIVGILQSYLKLDLYQGIVLVILFFISIIAIQINYRSSASLQLLEEFKKQQSIWNEVLNGVRKLAKIQYNIQGYETKNQQLVDGLKIIASKYSSESDFFVQWFDDRLSTLLRDLQHTTETESYYFVEGQIREQDRMWKIFQGQETDWFWATSTCQSIEWFATPEGDYVTRGLDDMFRQGRIKSIRRLFLYDSEGELKDLRSALCFLLHEQSGYEYKVISRKDFESIFHRFGDSSMVTDFGIYGEHFVWETLAENRVYIESGYVCVNKRRILKYTDLYRKLWSLAVTSQVADEQLRATYKDSRMDLFRTLYQAANISKHSP